MGIINEERTSADLHHLLFRYDFNGFFGSVFIFLFFGLCRFCEVFFNLICRTQLIFLHVLIFRFAALFCLINFHRHKGAVFLKDFPCPVFIRKFIAVFVQI